MKRALTSLLLAGAIGFSGSAIAKESKNKPPKDTKPTPTPSKYSASKRPAPLTAQPIKVDVEVARVKNRLREIQSEPISKDKKVQMQRAFLNREIANAKAELRDIQNRPAEAGGNDHAKRLRDAIVDFMQKLASINPQIQK